MLTTLTGKSLALTISRFNGIYDNNLWITTETATGSVIHDATSAALQLESGDAGQYIDRTISMLNTYGNALKLIKLCFK
ncbi:hypothetical protein VB711_21295 [Cronbergia sp. UHCC 0137]|uniref:hypothetical protein n=1 Tax=Cronbergia sp. UHCC 0137 TaxID=3110239 RepID=UPI002B2028C0|nr:hypothetical protein [Cronbergia sp. UHCC 0137]MEA5620360.1 hypothetical protein [Cronbergia sp. UHCC 0137]